MSGQPLSIFITGGSSGLGLAMAKAYLNKGHRVGVCSIEPAEHVKTIIPTELTYYQVDVRDATAIKNALQDFAKKGLDRVIANAGISMPKEAIPDFSHGRTLLEINILGVWNTFAPAIEIMRTQGSGQLVALGSISGLYGLPGMAAYGASKSAVIKMCESLEIDLADFGIQVTTLVPGFIATPLTQHNQHKMPFLMTQEEAVKKMLRAIEARKGFYVFPWQLAWTAHVLSRLPRSWYKLIMKFDLLGLKQH